MTIIIDSLNLHSTTIIIINEKTSQILVQVAHKKKTTDRKYKLIVFQNNHLYSFIYISERELCCNWFHFARRRVLRRKDKVQSLCLIRHVYNILYIWIIHQLIRVNVEQTWHRAVYILIWKLKQNPFILKRAIL